MNKIACKESKDRRRDIEIENINYKNCKVM